MSIALISTHAPAGGATLHGPAETRVRCYFYSRPCGRGDRAARCALRWDRPISTHAPAGGATVVRAGRGRQLEYFYSRPCGRGDAQRFHTRVGGKRFLLTPLREGRRCCRASLPRSVTFLLTPLREGRHAHWEEADWREYISTHAPAGGATGFSWLEGTIRLYISTHAPAGGATKSSARSRSARSRFLLTPLREGRRFRECEHQWDSRNFYSRPCGRGDSNFPQVRHEVLRQIAER